MCEPPCPKPKGDDEPKPEDNVKAFKLVLDALKEFYYDDGATVPEVKCYVQQFLTPPMTDPCLYRYVEAALCRAIVMGFAKVRAGKYLLNAKPSGKPPIPCFLKEPCCRPDCPPSPPLPCPGPCPRPDPPSCPCPAPPPPCPSKPRCPPPPPCPCPKPPCPPPCPKPCPPICPPPCCDEIKDDKDVKDVKDSINKESVNKDGINKDDVKKLGLGDQRVGRSGLLTAGKSKTGCRVMSAKPSKHGCVPGVLRHVLTSRKNVVVTAGKK